MDKIILKKMQVVPQMLYPTETVASIDDKLVKKCYEAYVSGEGQICQVLVVCYEEYMFIYEGHEQVLAATNFRAKEIDVTEIDRSQLQIWSNDEDFESTLQNIGVTAIYDFEAIGGFSYGTYPSYYHRKGGV